MICCPGCGAGLSPSVTSDPLIETDPTPVSGPLSTVSMKALAGTVLALSVSSKLMMSAFLSLSNRKLSVSGAGRTPSILCADCAPFAP